MGCSMLRQTLDPRTGGISACRLQDGSSEHDTQTQIFQTMHKAPLDSLLSGFPEMCLYQPKINVTQRKGEGLAAYATIQIKSSEKASVGGT